MEENSCAISGYMCVHVYMHLALYLHREMKGWGMQCFEQAIWGKRCHLDFFYIVELRREDIWLKTWKKWNERAGERAQQVRMLAAKPNDLSLILESTQWKGRINHACCLLTSTCVALPSETNN